MGAVADMGGEDETGVVGPGAVRRLDVEGVGGKAGEVVGGEAGEVVGGEAGEVVGGEHGEGGVEIEDFAAGGASMTNPGSDRAKIK